MRRPVLAALGVLLGLAVYAWAVAWTFNTKLEIALPLPAWSMAALPLALYAGLTLLTMTRHRLTGFALFCSTHALLGLGAAALYAEIGGLAYPVAAAGAFWAFQTAALLQIVATVALVVP
ncbi:MAG: hypothetical protein ACREJG_07370, partial [Candidatus Rokuibacteriota bacterium]